jgi:hypothetical protein
MPRSRVELEAWISHPCLVEGAIGNWQQNDQKGDFGICLSQCTIEGSDWVAFSDHMWFFVDLDLWQRKKSVFGRLQAGRRIAYLGRVQVYRRSNGSYDLAVKHDPELVRLSLYLQSRSKMSLEYRAKLHNSKLIINDFRINQSQDLDYYRQLIDKDRVEVEQGLARMSVGNGVDRDQLELKIKTIKRGNVS